MQSDAVNGNDNENDSVEKRTTRGRMWYGGCVRSVVVELGGKDEDDWGMRITKWQVIGE